jgi:hypothetical protein
LRKGMTGYLPAKTWHSYAIPKIWSLYCREWFEEGLKSKFKRC